MTTTAMAAAATEIIGREDELAALARFLDRDDLPAGLALVGDAGIGKTTLWRAGRGAASARDVRILEARPVEAEAEVGFAALGDLLAGTVDEILPELARPRRAALSVALLLEDASGVRLDQRAVGLAVADALRLLAARRRVLIAIDDAQWLDTPSRSVLAFALRRLGRARVSLLVAHRPQAELDLGLSLERVDVVPLSLGALSRLVQLQLGLTLRRPAMRSLHDVSGGNPLYALELARAYQRGHIRLELGEPLPTDVTGLLARRVEELPPRTRAALAASSASGKPSLGMLSAVLDESPRDALAPALEASIVELDDETVRFSHPLLASAAYGLVAASERRALHLKLASATTGEERARHLALATEKAKETVAAEVEAGAHAALARGAPAAAAELAEHASRLTPTSRRDDLRRRRTLEADARFEAGDPEAADAIVRELSAELPPGPSRAQLLGRLQRYRHFREGIDAGIELSLQALTEAGDDAELRAELHEGLAWSLMRRDVAAAREHARAAVACAERAGDAALLAQALAAHGVMAFIGGDGDAWALLERACALEQTVLDLRVLRHPTYARAYCLSCADRIADARAALRELRQRALDHGDETDLVHILKHLVLLECRAGRWDVAGQLADDAFELALQTDQRPQQAALLARMSLLAALRGEAEAARARAAQAVETATGTTLESAPTERIVAGAAEVALWALGLLALSLDDPAEAERHLVPLTRILLHLGVREPGELRCLPDAIEANARTGELELAEEWATILEGSARSVGRPSALAMALRARAFVEAGRGDVASAARSFAAALNEAPLELPFERARTLLALGSARRRLKERRAARESLEAARDLFENLGAHIWAEKARRELAAIGGRAKGAGQLTPSERRLAELVAEGLSNKQIAAALFVTPKTVDTKLSRIYAKLHVHSRLQLAHWLRTQQAGELQGSGFRPSPPGFPHG